MKLKNILNKTKKESFELFCENNKLIFDEKDHKLIKEFYNNNGLKYDSLQVHKIGEKYLFVLHVFIGHMPTHTAETYVKALSNRMDEALQKFIGEECYLLTFPIREENLFIK